MIIVMKKGSSAKQVSSVVARVEALGYRVHLSEGEERTIIGVIGDDRPIDRTHFEMLDGVEKTVPILKPFKMASRDMHPQDTIVSLGERKDRRAADRHHGRAVLGGNARADHRDGAGRERSGRAGSARRRVQAALIAVSVFRVSAKRVWNCWRKRGRSRACPSSPK